MPRNALSRLSQSAIRFQLAPVWSTNLRSNPVKDLQPGNPRPTPSVEPDCNRQCFAVAESPLTSSAHRVGHEPVRRDASTVGV